MFTVDVPFFLFSSQWDDAGLMGLCCCHHDWVRWKFWAFLLTYVNMKTFVIIYQLHKFVTNTDYISVC